MRASLLPLTIGLLAGCAQTAAPDPGSSTKAATQPAAPATQASTQPTADDDASDADADRIAPAGCEEPRLIDEQAAFAQARALGEDVTPFLFDNAVYLSGGLVRVYKGAYEAIGAGTKFGLMNVQGQLVVPFEWDYIGFMCQGQARACKGCKKDCFGEKHCEHWRIVGGEWSCIDTKGAIVPCNEANASAR